MALALGIDLGTTYTVVAVIADGRPKIVPNAEGQRLTPSVIACTQNGRLLVGQLAKRQAAANAERTVFSIKRRMGSDYRVRLGAREYTPQEVSSLILRKVKADAEDYLGEKTQSVVITVPAYFNDRQRQATKEAGALAGLDVIRIINEPTAAALAYGLGSEDSHTILVWDLGGGTFDVSILELGQGIFEVKVVNGDTWLGGDDYDRRLMDYLAQEYRQQLRMELPPHDGMAWQRLKEAAEKAKIELSTATASSIRIPFFQGAGDRPRYLETTLTREKFQELTADLVQRMVPPTRQALADAGLRPQDIDRVILVGGASRMPAVQNLVKELLGKEPYCYLNPDETVALGAALHAGVLTGLVKKVVLLDVIPLSLGIETLGGLFSRVIPRNTPLPASQGQVFTTARDKQTSMDIHVLQGERELALNNISLGQFQLEGIPPLPRGMPKIEVVFDVDVDGIVHVSATDLLTENSREIRVVSSRGLPVEAIQRMVAEAEVSAEKDREKRQRIEAGIQADNIISAAEMLMEEAPGDYRQVEEIQRAVLKVKEALASAETDEILQRGKQLKDLLDAIHSQRRKATAGKPCS